MSCESYYKFLTDSSTGVSPAKRSTCEPCFDLTVPIQSPGTAPMHLEKQLYEFGPFRIDSVERLLFRGDDVIPLTPKAIDTLLALISNPGRVLDKDELMKMVWQDTF